MPSMGFFIPSFFGYFKHKREKGKLKESLSNGNQKKRKKEAQVRRGAN
jgi:hypothetical protein